MFSSSGLFQSPTCLIQLPLTIFVISLYLNQPKSSLNNRYQIPLNDPIFFFDSTNFDVQMDLSSVFFIQSNHRIDSSFRHHVLDFTLSLKLMNNRINQGFKLSSTWESTVLCSMVKTKIGTPNTPIKRRRQNCR